MNSFYTCMYSTTELSQRHEIVKNNVIDKWSEGIASLQNCALQCLSLCWQALFKYGARTYVCVPAVFTVDSFSSRLSSKFKAWAMSRLSRFLFLRFSADGITFGESSPASCSESKNNNMSVKLAIHKFKVFLRRSENRSSPLNHLLCSRQWNCSPLGNKWEENCGKIYILLSQRSRAHIKMSLKITI